MERKKYILTGLILFMAAALYASAKTDIYKAYISSNMTEWKRVMDHMEPASGKSNEHILELLNYQYGYVAWCLGNKKHALAEEYVRKGEANIRLLESRAYQMSMVYAYKVAFIGFRIGLNKLEAPFIGPRSLEYARKAISLDRNSPFGYVQYGHTQYFMPKIFGGSKEIALENYNKALSLMEAKPEGIRHDWNYLNLLTVIAMAYRDSGDFIRAKACYEKILRIEPDYQWVKKELYPQLLKESGKASG